MQQFTYEFYQKSADYILERIPKKPEVALILGSSLGALADEIQNPLVIEYKDIPNYLVSTVESHASRFIFGELGGKYVVVMSGRFHFYEGYDFEQLAAPIRVLKLIGAHTTILTNIAGAVNISYNVGDIMLIKDHIKLMGASPLRGPNISEFGPRFFDVSNMYDKDLRKLALDCAERLGQSKHMREGVYFYFPGPQFESPAEIRAIRILGGDAAGMSTVTEGITAAHCGMRLVGLSLMSNMASGVLETPISDEEVSKATSGAAVRFKALIRLLVEEI
ncbi:MAG: purine-nucleoside phosphorylase [Oscillospiraceae bacterium]